MQKKILSTYKVTHEDGNIEFLNAENMVDALQNLTKKEEEVPVTAALRTQTGIPSLFPDDPTEVELKVYTDPLQAETGCKATPANASVHVGDQVTLEAFPARNYAFEGWKVDGQIVSKEPKYVLTIPEPAIPGDILNVLAEFKAADVTYTVKVEPPEATGDGCAAGPGRTVAPNEEVEIYAVDSELYKFDGWERNKQELGALPVLKTNVAPLAEDEKECVYTAKFSLQA